MKHRSNLFNAVATQPNLFTLVRRRGIAGLENFLERGGKLNDRPQYGSTELMDIARFCGAKGVKLFFDHGGKTNPQAQDNLGRTEADYIETYANDALHLYAEKAEDAIQIGSERLQAAAFTNSGRKP